MFRVFLERGYNDSHSLLLLFSTEFVTARRTLQAGGLCTIIDLAIFSLHKNPNNQHKWLEAGMDSRETSSKLSSHSTETIFFTQFFGMYLVSETFVRALSALLSLNGPETASAVPSTHTFHPWAQALI